MSESKSTATADAWTLIDQEKRRDRFIRRMCITAWSVTFGVLLVFALLVSVGVIEMLKAGMAGAVPWMAVVGAAMPLMGALWTLCLLVASLTTVGVFLRFRTASLTEIQLRLAALEEMLASRGDKGPNG